jgi:Kef-type K+ transport system membrane component KefB
MHHATLFFWIAVILMAARFGSLVERFGQPAVLGELLAGIVLGNLGLAGFHMADALPQEPIIVFLAELGVVVLLFQVGLESQLQQMLAVGARATAVAVVGVAVPFALGTLLVGPWLLPGLDVKAYLFIGATLTATSVGITGRVFRDLGRLQSPEARIVLGAAVIDDVLGLVILAVVSAIVTTGSLDAAGLAWIVAKAVLFLSGAVVLGRLAAPRFSRGFARIQTSAGMKITVALATGLVFAWLASLMDLAPIVGAFAAGLVLDDVLFHEYDRPLFEGEVERALEHADEGTRARIGAAIEAHRHRHLEDLIAPIGHFLVPIFFVFTGMQVKLELLADPKALAVAAGLTVAAVAGKIVAGLAAGPVDRWLVGWGMVPRGEVGLIFAATGMALGVVTASTFSVIVIMIVLTTFITPPVLAFLIRRADGGA